VGVRTVLTAGMLCAAAGMALLSGITPGGTYFGSVLPGGVLSGFGMGLALVSGTIAAVRGVPSDESGLASGLLNTSRLIGGALGLAVLSTIAATHTRGELALAVPSLRALTDGFQLALSVGALFALAGALVAALLLRPRGAVPVPAVAQAPVADGEPDPGAEAIAA
jgi:hypothetical protein